MLTDISEITPHLFLTSGMAVTENNLKRLRIRLVINATKELPICPLGDDIRVVKIPVSDKPKENLYKYFDEVCCLIDETVSAGENVLVHCVAGVSRSAALCMAYLIRHARMDLMSAYDHVKRRRLRVRPNHGFVTQLMDWEWSVHGIDLICRSDNVGLNNNILGRNL